MTSQANRVHKLLIRAENNPKTATEGEKVVVSIFIKNIGDFTFPGGELVMRFFPAALGSDVYVMQPLVFSKPIEPNSETQVGSGGMIPMASGYTLFIIDNFTASDNIPVNVYEINNQLCFPHKMKPKAQVFHSVRAQSHEEISQRQSVRIAIAALVVVAIFQVLDWAFRFFLKV